MNIEQLKQFRKLSLPFELALVGSGASKWRPVLGRRMAKNRAIKRPRELALRISAEN